MLDRFYADFAWEQAAELLQIDSPSGFTAGAALWVKQAFEALCFSARLTGKGGLIADLGGTDRENALLLEKTPCFIWSADLAPMEVDKTLNTSDLLPTLLNLLGVDSPYDYIGQDAFDPTYEGYALFSDGSWIRGSVAYDAASGEYIGVSGGVAVVSEKLKMDMAERAEQFVRINNLILDTDYYKKNTKTSG